MSSANTPPFNPRSLHIKAFAEQHAHLQGETPLAEFPRLLEECPQTSPAVLVQWQAQGSTRQPAGGSVQIWLEVSAHVTLQLTCQRCLQGMDQAVSVTRSFRLVHDEATAAQLDEEIEEDVLVYSRHFKLLELVEDELIMAMPLAPRHEVCADMPASAGDVREADATPHPFAILGQLRKPT